MIGHLRGQLLAKKPSFVLLDVHGVGYEVHIPVTTFYDLPSEGTEVQLRVYTHVREDALLLYGFGTLREKEFFLKLIGISGIGPRAAISILSGAKVEELAQAIADGDLVRLTAIPGVGRKTAERVVLELRGQIMPFLVPAGAQPEAPGTRPDALQDDIVSALVNLGYARPSAEKAISAVLKAGDCERTFEELLRRTLRKLAG
jgi:Holliday junction DNA helicase RuvA